MKKRIIALVLVVVMSLLSLVSCGGSFNFAEEDLSAYADFDYAAFKAALQKLEIEDGEYTSTDSDVRTQLELEAIYDKVAAAVIKNAYESDRKTEGALGKGDVLYFVYYAVDEETGNVYFTSQMQDSTITHKDTSANHVVNLGNVDDENEFMTLIKENIGEVNLEECVYNMLTAAELKAAAKEALLAENKDATTEQITAAQAESVKVKAGQTIVISYSRSYKTTNEDGTESTTKESAGYVTITLDPENPFHAKFLEEKAMANIGDTLKVYDAETEKNVTSFSVTEGDKTYEYDTVSILWSVESEGKAIATFKYKPYTVKTEVVPDNLTTGSKVDLKDKELTYYVYPSYALSAPSTEELSAMDLLVHLYGKSLTSTSFELFEDEEYKNGEKKLSELASEIAKIYKTSDTTYYAEGTELKELYDKTVADSKDTDAAEALVKAQNAKAKEIFTQIIEAKKGEELAGDALFEEYREEIAHELKDAYDNDIADKVQAAVWELIQESVVVKDYPAEVVEEFYEILYESYESDYYTGDFSTSVSNYNKYESFEAFLIATLKVSNASEIEAAITKEAKEYLKPIIQIFVVAQACAKDGAAEKVAQYIETDIKNEVYTDQETIDSVREEGQYFLADDSYMKFYKKEVGRSYYRNMLEAYGEINIRAGFQFNKLFYYLTSANIVMNEEHGDHSHTVYEYVTIDGVEYLDFRTIKYVLVEPSEDEEEVESDTENENEGEGDHDH